MKKPIYKRVWFWVLIIIIIGSIGSRSTSDSKADDSDNNASTEIVSEENKSNKEYKIKETVRVGDVSYKVQKISTTKSVGPSVLPTTAKDTFVVVKLSIKNNGSKEITIDSNFFKLLADGKEFEADSMASLSANQGENGEILNSFFYDSLNPDVSLTGYVVFDVSSKLANNKDLKLQVQTGIWGTEKEIISLK